MGTARVQGQRDVALNELPFRGIALNDATDNTNTVQVYASDSGILFINKFVDTVVYTLPAIADGAGKMFWFYTGINQIITITSPTATTLFSVGALGTSTSCDAAYGGSCMVVGDGSYYYMFEISGAWA